MAILTWLGNTIADKNFARKKAASNETSFNKAAISKVVISNATRSLTTRTPMMMAITRRKNESDEQKQRENVKKNERRQKRNVANMRSMVAEVVQKMTKRMTTMNVAVKVIMEDITADERKKSTAVAMGEENIKEVKVLLVTMSHKRIKSSANDGNAYFLNIYRMVNLDFITLSCLYVKPWVGPYNWYQQ